MQRGFLLAVAAVIVAAVVVWYRTQPPDIVIFLVDDAGWADFSMHGSEIPTPRIDALAESSVRFTQGYVAASICSPSRAALLTGRYPQRFGHETNPPVGARENTGLPLTETLLPEHLAPAGYTSALIGKWHLGEAAHFHPNQRGFDHFSGFLKGQRHYTRGERNSGRWQVDGAFEPESFSYVTDHIAAEAVRFLGSTWGPALVVVSFSAVHAPLQGTDADLAAVPATEPRKELAAMTVALDRAVGTVLDAVSDDAVVWFLNDNGAGPKNTGSNLPFRGGKSRVYEGGIRVPFTLRAPGLEPGSFAQPVSALDILPTVLAIADQPRPEGIDGANLIRHIQDRTAPHELLFWKLGDTWAVRDARFKLVHDRDDGFGMFDLQNDPEEANDLGDHFRRGALLAAWKAWDADNVPPAFESSSELRQAQERRELPRSHNRRRRRSGDP